MAQVDHTRKHWVFGKNAVLSFDNSGVSNVSSGPLNAYTGSACYSNLDGDLILSTNGNAVYGKNNELISVLFDKPPTIGHYDALIIPKNEAETQFYLFIIEIGVGLRTVDVDIENKTAVLRPGSFNETGHASNMTAVKHCFSDAYWLIFPDNASRFYSFLVKPNSISEPVVSIVPSNRGNVGDFVSSHDGTLLALSSYLGDWAEMYDFDKKCGTISNPRILRKAEDKNNKPHGISFAPDDKSVYVAWSHAQSNLLQYDIENWGSIANAVNSSENINDILLGIDGDLYLNVHENGIPSRRIHVVRNPNGFGGGGTRAVEDIATLPPLTDGAFEFPTFISNTTGGGCGETGDFSKTVFIDNKNRCTNKDVKFIAEYIDNTYDSIRWDFDDPGSDFNSSTESNINKRFDKDRIYNVECYAFYCSFIDTFDFVLDMKHPPSFSLGNDTSLCSGASVVLEIPLPYDSFIWADGYLNASRTEELGVFEARISYNTCIVSDTIEVRQFPDIWIELGEEYYICDLETETTILDAGKGFKKYKWTPTGDTTQWIIVSDVGEYIVVVDAFNGCQGEGRTVVKRRCDLEYHIPNAFTPNADSRNDLFRVNGENIESATLHIYNRWGEKIFEGTEWDGNNAQSGVYFYTVSINGYTKKIPVTYTEKGTIHLLR